MFLARLARFVRFSHTIFALPFALGAMLVAAGGWPTGRVTLLILGAMVAARTAAMCFNRLADWEIDQRNPRTVERHRLVPRGVALALMVVSSAGLVAASWGLNAVCLALSPVALALVFGYSLTKRFTSCSHFFLGLALSAAPVGAWLAVRGSVGWPPLILALGVLLWVAGFDMIYATLDVEFDRAAGLHSWAVRRGVGGALRTAMVLHGAALVVLVVFGVSARLGLGYVAACVAIAVALVYEHWIAARRDVGAVNRAFFHANAVVGAVFLLGVAWDAPWTG